MKMLVSSLSDGHAFTLLVISQNLRTICLTAEGKEKFKKSSNDNKNNNFPPRGFKYYLAQGSVSESPNSVFVFCFFFLIYIFMMYNKHI